MARIKIKDLPQNQKISQEELKKVLGGVITKTGFSSLGSFDFGSITPTIAGCGCSGMPQDPKEAGC